MNTKTGMRQGRCRPVPFSFQNFLFRIVACAALVSGADVLLERRRLPLQPEASVMASLNALRHSTRTLGGTLDHSDLHLRGEAETALSLRKVHGTQFRAGSSLRMFLATRHNVPPCLFFVCFLAKRNRNLSYLSSLICPKSFSLGRTNI